jgi:hypothetical protein
LNDLEKLLTIFYISKNNYNAEYLRVEAITSIIYLLRRDHGVTFNYPMRFLPLPSSPSLTDDLESLTVSGYYLRKGNSLAISGKGDALVENKGYDALILSRQIEEPLGKYVKWKDDDFFRAIYNSSVLGCRSS